MFYCRFQYQILSGFISSHYEVSLSHYGGRSKETDGCDYEITRILH